MGALLAALRDATTLGCSIRDLLTATGKGRSSVYAGLQVHAARGTVAQVGLGH